MIRLLMGILFLLGLACLSAWVAEAPGHVMIDWRGWRIETSLAFLTAAMLLAGAAFWMTLRLLLSAVFFRRRWRNRQNLKRHQRGLEALTRALAALALSDLKTAESMAKKAESLLDHAPITLVMSAQLARAQHNDIASKRYLEAMLDHPDTKLLAHQGLIEQARRRGDPAAALTHANDALRTFPRDSFVLQTLIDLYSQEKKWQEALLYIDRAVRAKAFSRDRGKYLRAAIYAAAGMDLADRHEYEAAMAMYKQSLSQHDGVVAAAIGMARVLIALKQPKKAVGVIEKAWKAAPHPHLAELYLSLIPENDADKWLKAARKVVEHYPHPEGYILLARLSMRAQQWEAARGYLQQSLKLKEHSRALHLMAELEEHQYGDHAQAAKFLARAREVAPSDPLWSCGECGTVASHWSLHCPACRGFDSISWKSPLARLPAVRAA